VRSATNQNCIIYPQQPEDCIETELQTRALMQVLMQNNPSARPYASSYAGPSSATCELYIKVAIHNDHWQDLYMEALCRTYTWKPFAGPPFPFAGLYQQCGKDIWAAAHDSPYAGLSNVLLLLLGEALFRTSTSRQQALCRTSTRKPFSGPPWFFAGL
jgi:hypothetical protein